MLLVALLLLAPTTVTQAAVKLPELALLVRAVRTGDSVEIERVAARFGAVKLERIAEHGRREERLAALRGLSVVGDAWYLLPELSRLLDESDPDVAEAAALSVRQIAAGLSPQSMYSEEVPRDVPARAAASLQESARRAELRPSVRVAAIGALASLRAVAKLDEAGYTRLLADAEPQIRRAAAEGLTGVAGADTPLQKTLEEDPAPDVAAAAAAALCRDVPASGDKGAAFERAAKFSPRARDRLRQLAAAPEVPLVDKLDLLGCVRVHAQPDDQKVLDLLARGKSEPLKRRARSLGGR